MDRRRLCAAAAAAAAASTIAFTGTAALAAPSAGPGSQLWASRYNGPGNGDDLGTSVAEAAEPV